MSAEKEYKNIVIIGASIAGHSLVNDLYPYLSSEYRILLVDALDFAFWPIAAIRAATAPGWENKLTVPLTDDRVFPAGSQHRVIAPNKLVECKEASVVLEHPFEGSNEIPFWRCVIATGAKQQAPLVPDLSSTEEEYKQLLRQYQRDLKEVKDVVIIGGGAVGIEYAGDIRCINEKANITIVHPRSGLLEPTPLNPIPASTTTIPTYSSPPVDPRLSKNLAALCRKLNIELILEDRVVIPKDGEVVGAGKWEGKYGKQEGVKVVGLASGKQVKADWVIMAAGTQPNSWMVANKDEGALDGKLIRVDEYLKVISTNEKSIFNGQYYAIGDVCSAPGFKAARGAGLAGSNAAVNLIAEIKNKSRTKFSPGIIGLGIPVGHHEAAGMAALPWIGNVMLGGALIRMLRGEDMLISKRFVTSFTGPNKVHIDFDDVLRK
ncbi:hypothetical protein L202_00364 [Cryptococcus amylolentus CBS 6039]|uniref:FAD/NAD(P)-binding domain-containing protein n=2 Tax=Cryptococcus amylolentus TaxID=104669 RepID=A0A1E3I6Y9_9TREE|nr:hypothetical protein L202_00364 [Cryptococcus amylolentus CBS 6039]ODN84409.1 hypothetical protein L202_00364 [Cryptococcus amylolentus CBS 6039]ODO11782.1 hypothetical protein I350_00566 [Cryptococcus amylolentus CBS 6273]